MDGGGEDGDAEDVRHEAKGGAAGDKPHGQAGHLKNGGDNGNDAEGAGALVGESELGEQSGHHAEHGAEDGHGAHGHDLHVGSGA